MALSRSLLKLLLASSCISLTTAAPGPRRTWDVHGGPSGDNSGSSKRSVSATASNGTCPLPKDVPTTAKKPSPFRVLSDDLVESIVQWVQDPARKLNLTDVASSNLTQSDNYIWLIEPLMPNKTDVLAYLDKNETIPDLFARVVVNEGGKENPDVSEYSVGPLPIGPTTKMESLDWMYNGVNGAHVPFNGRYPDSVRSKAIDSIVAKTMSSIADITLDLVGFAYYGSGNKNSTGTYFVQNPASTDGSKSFIWTPWRRSGLASYDRPSDLYVSFDISGTDSSLYHMRMILYNLVIYHSVEEFRAAWANGTIVKTPPPTTSTDFLKKDRKGPIRELEQRFAPTSVELDGKRYKVDHDNKYIEYLGWSFYTRFDRDVGIQFFDIKFKGERVLYELSLQDAIAQYAGNNPFQAGTGYNDRFYGIGAQAGRLIPGFDCPYHATYWNSTYNDGVSLTTTNNTLCIFESDIGHPVTRHSDRTYMHSTKGSKLTVRMIATVGNYDYLWDYTFLVDGSIGVDAHASGYVQGNYYRPDDERKWGPRIQETISGTLHTHVMNFKADFDIIDSNNTFLKTDIIVENITQPWFPERGTFEMMRYNFTEIATEDDGLLPLPSNGQSMYTVMNKNKKNKWGENRGYRIIPGLSNVHLASMHSPFFLKSGQYAKQAFAVSHQHDHEPSSSAALNQNVPEAPPVEFWKFFNGEDLIQEDIVTWVNLGMHHYTRAEDIPNTLMTEAHSSIMFAPQNWGDAELTIDLTNAIIYNENDDGSIVEPETNGVTVPQCLKMLPQDELLGVFEGVGTGKLQEIFSTGY